MMKVANIFKEFTFSKLCTKFTEPHGCFKNSAWHHNVKFGGHNSTHNIG
jgi:hypothetical protein